MPIQPRPSADTSRLLFPSLRFSIVLLPCGVVRLFGLEGCHIDREAILHVRLRHPLISFVNLLHRNHLHVGGDIVLSAEVEHLLSFSEPADRRARKTPAS